MQLVKHKHTFLYIIIFFFSSHFVFAQLSAFRKLTIEEGLSNNFVRTIYKDKQGYIWFGTLEGLDRFDGVDIVSYSESFNGEKQSVNTIIDGANNVMWIGTEQGLYYSVDGAVVFSSVDFNVDNISVKKLLLLPGDSVLFAGTSKGGYCVNCKTFKAKEVVGDVNISDAVICPGEKIWLSTLNGLVEFDYSSGGKRVFRNIHEPEASFNSFSAISFAKGELIAGTQSRGLFRFNPEDGFIAFGDIGNNYILSLHYHDDGRLFVGTDGGGLVIADVEKGSVINSLSHNISNPQSLNSNSVYSFLLDEKGRYWVGTYSGGVNFSSGTAGDFKVLVSKNNVFIGQKNIRSLFFYNGDEYIGTRDGLIIVEKTGKAHFINTSDNSNLRSNIILSFYSLGEDILVGTYGGGVSKINQRTRKIQIFRKEDDFINGAIYGFERDKQNNLWVASLNGIYCIESKTGKTYHFSVDNSNLPDNRIYSVFFDSQNRLWVGTMSGVAVYSTAQGEIIRIKPDTVLPRYKTVFFYEDNSHNIWIATEQGGLFKVSTGLNEISRYTEENGLPNNSVSAITEAPLGVFWISTLKGLCRLDAQNQQINNYSLSDGLPGLMFNPGAIVNQFQSKGLLWLGNEQGLVYFSPENVLEQKRSEKVLFSDLYLSGHPVVPVINGVIEKPLVQLSKLVLKGNQNNIGFRFVALNYFLPSDNQYLYRLKDLDDEWKSTGAINRVFFQGVKPGKYILEVCLAKGNGQPDMASLSSLEIEIKPLFFQNQVVLVLSIFLFLLLFLLIYRMILKLRNKVIEAQYLFKEKESQKYEASRLSADRSKELLEQVIKYVEESKVFLEPDLKIGDLAESLSCSYHDLSQVINQCLNQSFSEFINHYRIEEVKRRLTDEAYAKYTLLAVAESCGFNSKTSFYRVFKKETGITPAEYIQSISKK